MGSSQGLRLNQEAQTSGTWSIPGSLAPSGGPGYSRRPRVPKPCRGLCFGERPGREGAERRTSWKKWAMGLGTLYHIWVICWGAGSGGGWAEGGLDMSAGQNISLCRPARPRTLSRLIRGKPSESATILRGNTSGTCRCYSGKSPPLAPPTRCLVTCQTLC